MHMFIGLDVHKKSTEVAIVDEERVTEKKERIENEPGRIRVLKHIRLGTSQRLGQHSNTSCSVVIVACEIVTFGVEYERPDLTWG